MNKKRAILGFLIASAIMTFLIIVIPILLIGLGMIHDTKSYVEIGGLPFGSGMIFIGTEKILYWVF